MGRGNGQRKKEPAPSAKSTEDEMGHTSAEPSGKKRDSSKRHSMEESTRLVCRALRRGGKVLHVVANFMLPDSESDPNCAGIRLLENRCDIVWTGGSRSRSLRLTEPSKRWVVARFC